MTDVLTISTQKPADVAFDYEALRKAGIQYIEQTASRIWTDYNIHDPGITSLELLCYAITDLSYRSNYAVPDLMFGEHDTAADIIDQFHTAAKIFPNSALTINDYRKLIIDVEGIKNAWLRKKTKSIIADLTHKVLTREAQPNARTKQVIIKGYYDVLLEFDTTVTDEEAQKTKIEEVRKLLQDNRNLDEDFDSIGKVPQQHFRLCSEIDIAPTADPFEVLAQIYFGIQLYLSPLVRFYSLQQMLADNYSTDKIFEGPFITHGFIKEEELIASELRTEIHLSDLMQIILNTPGVVNIPDIIFNDIAQSTPLPNKWIIDVTDGFQPVVDILESNVLLYKNGIPFRPDKNDVKARFELLMKNFLEANEAVTSSDIVFNTGSYQNVADYYSIQHHYPKTYGISDWGLPEDAPLERKKQAKQFQGYLWLFDQLLANYLKQLSSVKNLFSLSAEHHTYFTQLVNDFKDAEQLFVDPVQITTHLQQPAETNTVFLTRRNRFLDHLLSRFAESFYDYAAILNSLFPSADPLKVINAKRTFLKGYPEYSSERAKAYNYTNSAALWDSNNISGFEKRVQRLLGFENIFRRSLANIYFVIHEEEISGIMNYWFEIIDNHNGNILLQGAEKQTDKESAEEELEVALALAAAFENFKIIETTPGNFIYELRDKLNKLVATGMEGTEPAVTANLLRLTSSFSNMSEEGMFLVEHLLLYGDTINDFLPICVDENCDECSDTDPYSFRISIVMPAYAPRFMNMDFRRYAENVMREEMPSHLLVKICWVSNEQLHDFEVAYKAWLEVKAGIIPDEDGSILKQFITVLTSLKNIYPQTRLMDCSSKEERRLFLLNRNALGTQKTT